jgi:transcriptional regulator with XRE-family HTH domain
VIGRARPETFYSRPFIRLASKIATEKGLTIDDLAARAQIRRSRMTRYERGTVEPWISDVFSVAKALDVSPIWFFGRILAEGKAARSARMRENAATAPRP